MAWVTPSSKADGTLITAAHWNQDVVDNISYLYNADGALAYNSATVEITHNTFTDVTFNSERYDNNSIHDTSTNTDRLVAQEAGVYLIAGQIRWEAVAGTSLRWVALKVNGGTVAVQYRSAVNLTIDMNISTLYKLAATDYVELEVWQNSGGTLDVQYASILPPTLGMQWLGSGT